MNIRSAGINDIDKILVLVEQLLKMHSDARPDWIDDKKRPTNYEFFKKIIENNNWKIFVAEDENSIVAYCLLQITEIKNHFIFYDMTNIEIQDLCVDEKYREKGIGRKLFKAVEQFAKEKNVNFIELSVWEFNQGAKQFYEHMGMRTRINRMELKIE
jgi:ribosomal protein S18 acetylase RimI-like enzyme